jgi:CRISPR-associated endoribonuclease Cas6
MGRGHVLPINYQYEFSAWIYKVLYQGDKAFAGWLHEQGYAYGKKRFKLFTFSQLETYYKIFKDRFKLLSDEAELIVTFHIDEAVQHFISGLFKDRQFSIGDKRSRVSFEVQTVETLQEPVFKEEMVFKALSPICVSKPVDNNGKLRAKYLMPGDEDFELRFINNLFSRYKALNRNGMTGSEGIEVNVKGKAKSRLIKIKADTPAQTKVRGSLFNFTCKAPAELLRLGYEAGFGEKNSLGFGCVGVEGK